MHCNEVTIELSWRDQFRNSSLYCNSIYNVIGVRFVFVNLGGLFRYINYRIECFKNVSVK